MERIWTSWQAGAVLYTVAVLLGILIGWLARGLRADRERRRIQEDAEQDLLYDNYSPNLVEDRMEDGVVWTRMGPPDKR